MTNVRSLDDIAHATLVTEVTAQSEFSHTLVALWLLFFIAGRKEGMPS